MVISFDDDTPLFDMTTVLLQGDTLSLVIFIICIDYILKKSLDINSNLCFTFIKIKARDTQLYILQILTMLMILHAITNSLIDANILLYKISVTYKVRHDGTDVFKSRKPDKHEKPIRS